MHHDQLATGLRVWAHGQDPHVRAAVELLLDHDGGMWLRREEFVEAFVGYYGNQATIDFDAVAAALAEGTAPGASSTELGILRLAADLGTDRWLISRMSDETVHLVRTAIAVATE